MEKPREVSLWSLGSLKGTKIFRLNSSSLESLLVQCFPSFTDDLRFFKTHWCLFGIFRRSPSDSDVPASLGTTSLIQNKVPVRVLAIDPWDLQGLCGEMKLWMCPRMPRAYCSKKPFLIALWWHFLPRVHKKGWCLQLHILNKLNLY